MEVPVKENPEIKDDSLIAVTSTLNPETPQDSSSMEAHVKENPETKIDSLIAVTSTLNPETPQDSSSMEVHVKENPETKIDSLIAETSRINPETPQESSSMGDSSNPNPEIQYSTCENCGEMATSYSYGAILCADCERDYVSIYAGLENSLMEVPVKENPETKDESSIAEGPGESSSMSDSTKQNPENGLNCELCSKQKAMIHCPTDSARFCSECDEKYHNLNFRFSTHIRFYLNHPNENPETSSISSMAVASKPTPETSKASSSMGEPSRKIDSTAQFSKPPRKAKEIRPYNISFQIHPASLLKSALDALSYLTVMEHNCGILEVTERGLLISTGCSKEVNILGSLRLKADDLFCFCCFNPIRNLIDLTDFTNQVSAADDDDEINAYHYDGSSVIHFITVPYTDGDHTINVRHFKESSKVPFVTGGSLCRTIDVKLHDITEFDKDIWVICGITADITSEDLRQIIEHIEATASNTVLFGPRDGGRLSIRVEGQSWTYDYRFTDARSKGILPPLNHHLESQMRIPWYYRMSLKKASFLANEYQWGLYTSPSNCVALRCTIAEDEFLTYVTGPTLIIPKFRIPSEDPAMSKPPETLLLDAHNLSGILRTSKDKPQTSELDISGTNQQKFELGDQESSSGTEQPTLEPGDQETSSGTDQPTLGPGDQERSSGTDQPSLEPGEQENIRNLEDTTIFSKDKPQTSEQDSTCSVDQQKFEPGEGESSSSTDQANLEQREQGRSSSLKDILVHLKDKLQTAERDSTSDIDQQDFEPGEQQSSPGTGLEHPKLEVQGTSCTIDQHDTDLRDSTEPPNQNPPPSKQTPETQSVPSISDFSYEKGPPTAESFEENPETQIYNPEISEFPPMDEPSEDNTDIDRDFIIGSVFSIRTTLGEVFEAQVIDFEHTLKILMLQEVSISGPTSTNIRLLNANYIEESTFLYQLEDPLDLKRYYLGTLSKIHLKDAIGALRDANFNQNGKGLLEVGSEGWKIAAVNAATKVVGCLCFKATDQINFNFKKMVDLNQISQHLSSASDDDSVAMYHENGSKKIFLMFGQRPNEMLSVDTHPLNDEFEMVPEIAYTFEVTVPSARLREIIQEAQAKTNSNVTLSLTRSNVQALVGRRSWDCFYAKQDKTTKVRKKFPMKFQLHHCESLKKASLVAERALFCFNKDESNCMMLRFRISSQGYLYFDMGHWEQGEISWTEEPNLGAGEQTSSSAIDQSNIGQGEQGGSSSTGEPKLGPGEQRTSSGTDHSHMGQKEQGGSSSTEEATLGLQEQRSKSGPEQPNMGQREQVGSSSTEESKLGVGEQRCSSTDQPNMGPGSSTEETNLGQGEIRSSSGTNQPIMGPGSGSSTEETNLGQGEIRSRSATDRPSMRPGSSSSTEERNLGQGEIRSSSGTDQPNMGAGEQRSFSGSEDCQTCLKCGGSGHDISSCNNGSSPDYLKNIQCCGCNVFGYLWSQLWKSGRSG